MKSKWASDSDDDHESINNKAPSSKQPPPAQLSSSTSKKQLKKSRFEDPRAASVARTAASAASAAAYYQPPRPLSSSSSSSSTFDDDALADEEEEVSNNSSTSALIPSINNHNTSFLLSHSSALVGPRILPCRSVNKYENLNRIDEGSYGIVYRARNRETGEIVALKRLKLEQERHGFPVTSLREIYTLLLAAKHPNIVDVKEIVVKPDLKGIYIVMEFVEHDLKALMEAMTSPFLQSEIKTLMLQLISAVNCMHQNWILHRDLKTSNLLMNNRGQIKVADFGLARRFGDPLGNMTQLVVTLWYRAPELLLGATEYDTAIDMWSIGCIFGELVNKEPLLPGRGEIDQITKIFKLLGTPTEKIWPGFSRLPAVKTVNFPSHPHNNLRGKFPYMTEHAFDLLSRLLCYDPKQRITAEEALRHPYFSESPPPKDPSLFPTFPSKGAGEKRKTYSPSAPLAAHGVDAGGGGGEVMDEEALRAALGVASYSTGFKDTSFKLSFTGKKL